MIDYAQLVVGLLMFLAGMIITESAIDDMIESKNGGVFDIALMWAVVMVDRELESLEPPVGDTRGQTFLNSKKVLLNEVKRDLELFKVRK